MKPRTPLVIIFASLVLLTFLADQWRRSRIEASQDQNILTISKRQGVNPALIKAVIWRESRFRPGVIGGKGELGLMQIMPDSTGRDWAGAQRMTNYTEELLLDPRQNIECGTWYLRKLLARYRATDEPMAFALADYNAGRSNALKWMKGAAATNSAEFIQQIGFESTRRYVRAILQREKKYASWAAEHSK
jgi:soluble lytic murein transglycosylase